MILLRKIMKNTSVSKEYSAAAGGKNLFIQPLETLFGTKGYENSFYDTLNDYLARRAEKRLFT
jgi:hypothetical protein